MWFPSKGRVSTGLRRSLRQPPREPQCADYATQALEAPLRELPRRERLWAALHRQTANNPHRRMLHAAAGTLRARAKGSAVSARALAWAWGIVALQRTFHFFTPGRQQLTHTGRCAAAPSLP
jgi:hypothetical protein